MSLDGAEAHWAAALAAMAGAGVMSGAAFGLFHPRANLFGPTLWRGPSHRPVVALTFDDGPHPYHTARIAEVLDRHRARATFFCIGRKLEQHATLAREIHRAGHELANHTYRHGTGRDLFSTRRLAADLQRCQEVLLQLTGTRARYYRPAVGIRNPVVHAAARLQSLEVVTWTHAARDGAFAFTPRRARALAERAGPGSIVALHDGAQDGRSELREQTHRNLPLLLGRLSERGLGFVTLAELLAGG